MSLPDRLSPNEPPKSPDRASFTRRWAAGLRSWKRSMKYDDQGRAHLRGAIEKSKIQDRDRSDLYFCYSVITALLDDFDELAQECKRLRRQRAADECTITELAKIRASEQAALHEVAVLREELSDRSHECRWLKRKIVALAPEGHPERIKASEDRWLDQGVVRLCTTCGYHHPECECGEYGEKWRGVHVRHRVERATRVTPEQSESVFAGDGHGGQAAEHFDVALAQLNHVLSTCESADGALSRAGIPGDEGREFDQLPERIEKLAGRVSQARAALDGISETGLDDWSSWAVAERRQARAVAEDASPRADEQPSGERERGVLQSSKLDPATAAGAESSACPHTQSTYRARRLGPGVSEILPQCDVCGTWVDPRRFVGQRVIRCLHPPAEIQWRWRQISNSTMQCQPQCRRCHAWTIDEAGPSHEDRDHD